jgi:beta-lactam-binding protein with PASTA domain
MKALAKPVEERYQSAAAMRADIERYLIGKPVMAPAVAAAAEGTSFLPQENPAEQTSTLGPAHRADDEGDTRKRKRWPLILAGIAVLALLVAAAFVGQMLFSSSPDRKSVPSLLNMTLQQAERAIEQRGLTVGDVERRASTDVPRNRVISQDPNPGSFLAEGEPVDLIVSRGVPSVVVPDVLGEDKETARAEIEDARLQARLVERDSDEPAGTVIDQRPRPAESVAVDTRVTVFFSDGPEEVPNVVGRQEGPARRILEQRGFSVSVERDTETPAEPGTVLEQSPGAGETLGQGSTVTITVSDFVSESPEPTPTPTPTEEPPTPTEEPSPSETETPTESPLGRIAPSPAPSSSSSE